MLKPPKHAGRYRCIVIDPPWDQRKTAKRKVRPKQSTRLDYSTMSFDALSALPINTWLAAQGFIWLWATNSKDQKTDKPIIESAFKLLSEWGLTYHTFITWHKKTGVCPFSPYQVITEHVLFAYKGKAAFSNNSLGKLQTFFTESPTTHSTKPACFYEDIRRYFPGPRLDMFARQRHTGFDGWGEECEQDQKRIVTLFEQ